MALPFGLSSPSVLKKIFWR